MFCEDKYEIELEEVINEVINKVINKVEINKVEINKVEINKVEINKVEINKDNVIEVCIYEPCQYKYLSYTSCIFILTTSVTFYYQKYDFIIYPGGLLLTSLNYWKKPKYNSWERTLDVSYVYISFIYNVFRSLGAQYAQQFYIYLFVALICYLLSNYNHRQKRLYVSALLHSFAHLFGNVALIYLYSGDIVGSCGNQCILDMCENLID